MRQLVFGLAAATTLAACQCGAPPQSDGETIVLAPVATPIRADVGFDATGQAQIAVRAGDRPVAVKLAVGAEDALPLQTTRDGDATVATAPDLPPSGSGLVVIERTEADGKESIALFEWTWTAAQPGQTEIFSADGQLMLRAKPGQIAASGRVSILSGVSGGPGTGPRELAGPYRIAGPDGVTLRAVFQVGPTTGFAPDDLHVYRLEDDGSATSVPYLALPETRRVSFDAVLPGTYVLVGRPGVAP